MADRAQRENDTARLEAFSDGVFAIAVTLLVLEIGLHGRGSLARQIRETWPSYIGYVISFVTIGIMWANHHAIFRLISRTTHGLIVANLLLLMTVSFLPFPTRVLADHLHSSHPDQRTAALFYSGTFIVIAITFQLLWRVPSHKNRLIRPGCEDAAAQITKSYRLGIPSYTLSTLLALVSVPASLAMVGVIALYWLIPRGEASGDRKS